MLTLLVFFSARRREIPGRGGSHASQVGVRVSLLSSRASDIQGGGIETFRAKSPDVSIDICSLVFPT